MLDIRQRLSPRLRAWCLTCPLAISASMWPDRAMAACHWGRVPAGRARRRRRDRHRAPLKPVRGHRQRGIGTGRGPLRPFATEAARHRRCSRRIGCTAASSTKRMDTREESALDLRMHGDTGEFARLFEECVHGAGRHTASCSPETQGAPASQSTPLNARCNQRCSPDGSSAHLLYEYTLTLINAMLSTPCRVSVLSMGFRSGSIGRITLRPTSMLSMANTRLASSWRRSQ